MGSEGIEVLMVTLALQGHMNPMLKFAKQLVSKGVRITIATNDYARHRMLDSKNSSALSVTNGGAAAGSNAINLEFFSDGLSHEFDRGKHADKFIDAVKTEGYKNLSSLITNLTNSGRKFSAIIINPFVPWVADIAAEQGIPCAALWIQASSVYSIYYHYFRHMELFPDLKYPNETVELPGLPVLEVRDLPTFILPSSPPHFRILVEEFVRNLDKIKWVLGSSFYELEEEIVKSMASLKPISSIGPLVSPFLLGKEETVQGNVDMWSVEDSCIQWLDKQPPSSVIYIAFGSIIILKQQQIESIAAALKKTKQPFLWVLKKSDHATDGELPLGFIEETKEQGLVVSWCPQERVLIHPALACFVTHCGWNSTLETVVAGVPVIAYPEWTDQPTDAKLLVDVFKMGVRMRNDEDGTLSTEEVERCIREISDRPGTVAMKEKAMELKAAAKKAIEPEGSSDKNINRFINEMIGKSFSNGTIVV
ncbi:hypothetical protein SLEP1_g8248 [Rubroshorea leprosula]|uniref:Glycosyltransferase n=1 Tax=Rubroshorea leprosula TaxID=152421 RepID=A0AAV5I5K7_9ROSI|nr:hypothetical protein SLEP1_g8248 [Rubroshorea leprosula]